MEKSELISIHLKVIESHFNVKLSEDDLAVRTSTYVYTSFGKTYSCFCRGLNDAITRYVNKTPYDEGDTKLYHIIFKYMIVSTDMQKGIDALKRINPKRDSGFFEIEKEIYNGITYYVIYD